jgi:capsular polysaccharide biosynthesis protein
MIEERIDFDSTNFHKAFPQFVLKLKNVILGPNGMIFDEDFNLIEETTQVFSDCNPKLRAKADEDAKVIKQNHEIIELDEQANFVYFLNRYNIYPYGHLMDCLQPLIKIDELNLNRPVILKNRTTSHCKETDKHLGYFGYKNNRVLRFDDYVIKPDVSTRLYKVQTMYYSSLAAPLARWEGSILDKVRDKYPRVDCEPTKLYLSRGTGNRHVINEDEVVAHLVDKGYSVLYGNEPLEVMIKHFSKAESIVFYHGSMIKNILFCEKEPKILEFCSVNRPDVSFRDNAHSKGYMGYKQFMLECDGEYNIHIDLKMLEDY